MLDGGELGVGGVGVGAGLVACWVIGGGRSAVLDAGERFGKEGSEVDVDVDVEKEADWERAMDLGTNCFMLSLLLKAPSGKWSCKCRKWSGTAEEEQRKRSRRSDRRIKTGKPIQ